MKILDIEIKKDGFGFCQISHDHHDYWSGRNDGAVLTSAVDDNCIMAIIKAKGWWIYVYAVSGVYAIKLASGDKDVYPVTVIHHTRTYINTISAEALAKAAEEELRYVSLASRSGQRKLALCRKAYGLSLEELAKRSSVDKTTIHRYESGEREIKQARYESVEKLAYALQRDIKEIV